MHKADPLVDYHNHSGFVAFCFWLQCIFRDVSNRCDSIFLAVLWALLLEEGRRMLRQRSRRLVLPLLLCHSSHWIQSRVLAFSSLADAATAPRAMIRDLRWVDLQAPPAELRPQFTMTNGQCFNWKPLGAVDDAGGGADGVWVGVVDGR
jgi:hypothetical protein